MFVGRGRWKNICRWKSLFHFNAVSLSDTLDKCFSSLNLTTHRMQDAHPLVSGVKVLCFVCPATHSNLLPVTSVQHKDIIFPTMNILDDKMWAVMPIWTSIASHSSRWRPGFSPHLRVWPFRTAINTLAFRCGQTKHTNTFREHTHTHAAAPQRHPLCCSHLYQPEVVVKN